MSEFLTVTVRRNITFKLNPKFLVRRLKFKIPCFAVMQNCVTLKLDLLNIIGKSRNQTKNRKENNKNLIT